MENHDLLLEQKNIQHAIIGDVITDLSEILSNLSKARLSALASTLKLQGRSKMKKDELAAALVSEITDVEKLESILLRLESAEWELFESLLDTPIQQDNFAKYGYYYFLMEHGLIFTYFNDNKLYLIVPDQVRTAYAQINQTEFRKAHDRRLNIYNYTLALTNLYGIFKPDQLLKIFNDQKNDSPLSEQELMSNISVFLEREQNFVLKDEYIVNTSLLFEGDEKEYNELLKHIKNKPHYVPAKNELLQYADDSYFEITKQLVTLRNYLSKDLCRDPELLDYLIDDIQLACSTESSLQEIVYEFERREIQFHNKEQAQNVMSLIADVYNHTRLWSNCGYTPTEMSKLPGNFRSGPMAVPFRVPNNQPVNVTKIGRNDPCPCGSGAKYKKCCGK
ncbi:YecA family protein [Paenibacillus segetis]|uniref:Zinc chelation protein SecC n=1 Tax=Paenibacillus segetis TaxID=1325360 RepID=A0ABQ1Y4P7_9BACL|nr:SEC-C metal-binding domain-containing protein [Paenibacillus segetis]GGH12055.1 zinc chelation protein SecC [Paenibacillus segetis]